MSTSSTSSTSSSSTGTTTTSSTGATSLISAGPLDVSQLVTQLMSVENQPLLALETQETGVNAQISAYGKISSALSTLQTSAQALELSSAFEAAKATVTGSGTTATVTGTPATGTYAVGVSQLAQSQAVASSPFTDLTAAVGSGTLTFQLGTYDSTGNTFTAQSGSSPSSITIDSSNNTPAGIAAAINNAGIGVQATVVNDVSGGRLLFSSSNSGAANGFKITVADSGDGNNTDNLGLSQLAFDPTATSGTGKNLTQTQTATNAQFTVNGLALSSASNAVTGVISGLTLNLTQAPPAGSAAGTTVQSQVTVGLDTSTVQASVQSMVTAYNAYVNLASTDSAYNSTTNTAAVLNGDSALDSISQQLSGIFASTTSSAAASGLSYLSQVGVQFQADGTLSLDATTFTSALTANPSAVAQLFTTATGTTAQQGFAYQIDNAVENMLLPDGTVSARTTGLKSSLTDMAQQQSDLQARLATDQTNLTNQYSALNAALETMQQQSTALTNMLSSLTTSAVGG